MEPCDREKKKTRLRASLRRPPAGSVQDAHRSTGRTVVDSRAPNAHRRPQGSHLFRRASPRATWTERRQRSCRRRRAPAVLPTSRPPVRWAARCPPRAATCTRPYARNPADGHALDPPRRSSSAFRRPARRAPPGRAAPTRRLKISCSSSRARFRAEAEVGPMPKAVVLVWGALDAEGERVGEDVLVAVGSTGRRWQAASPLRTLVPRTSNVLDGGAAELDDPGSPSGRPPRPPSAPGSGRGGASGARPDSRSVRAGPRRWRCRVVSLPATMSST